MRSVTLQSSCLVKKTVSSLMASTLLGVRKDRAESHACGKSPIKLEDL